MLQPMRYHFELQSTHSTQQQCTAGMGPKHLDRTLLAQLDKPQFELLAAHGVGDLDSLEYFRGEKRQTGKLQALPFCQRISQLQRSMIGDSDNIA